MKRKIVYLLLIAFVLVLTGCKKSGDKDIEKKFYYEEKLSENYDYNTNLFYVNKLEFEIADPSVIYISDQKSDQHGYFYAYGTSDDIRGTGIQSWRSKDLANWEAMGAALKPDFSNTWANIHYWAPEVIYDEGLYWMFYSANTQSKDSMNATGLYQMSVAYSKNPQGPFITPDNVLNGDGELITADMPVYNVGLNQAKIDPNIIRRNAIDISPFVDPKTGTKYIYFSYYDTWSRSEIFGMEMKDWLTPDYSTLKQLTAVGHTTVQEFYDNAQPNIAEGTINEGPFMTYDRESDTYYLTLSVYGYTDEKYQVRQALSDNPLGNFTKVKPEDGGTVIATDLMWSHLTSAGHHSFITIGEELFIAYHTFLNRTDVSNGRALAVDPIHFVEKNGKKVMHANGPTYSVQPLPEFISGYKNIAPKATISATNMKEGSDVKYLNDGLMAYLEHDFSHIPEFEAKEGTSKINLKWDNFVTARSIMVYNSAEYDTSFLEVDEINIKYKSNDAGGIKSVSLKNLKYDWDFLVENDLEIMKPGGSVTVEFDEMTIKEIEITINSVKGSMLSIPEIVVLGQEEDRGPKLEFGEYQYNNQPPVSPKIIKDGHTFGSNNGLHTMYGYNLENDKGEDDSFVTQDWNYDQFAYFKNVYSEQLYIEAEFSVPIQSAYMNDKYPKFGLTVSTVENTIFFFVDGNQTYTRDAIGVAQRMLDNTDWDWSATEQNVSGVNIDYTNDQFVKLTIIRDGKDFYFLANDKLYIFYDNFNIFNDYYKAAGGLLSFNTEMIVKNYKISDDKELIKSKIEEHKSQLLGETFGVSGAYATTSGWDLSNDNGTSEAFVENLLAGDQYAYFKDFSSENFKAEAEMTVVRHLGDSYPKFGIVTKNGTKEFFFFVDANPTYDNKAVGYVQRGLDGNWDWTNSKIINDVDIAYKDGDYVKLGLIKEGSKIIMQVNGVDIIDVSDLEGFAAADKVVVSLLTFTVAVKAKNYSITSDLS